MPFIVIYYSKTKTFLSLVKHTTDKGGSKCQSKLSNSSFDCCVIKGLNHRRNSITPFMTLHVINSSMWSKWSVPQWPPPLHTSHSCPTTSFCRQALKQDGSLVVDYQTGGKVDNGLTPQGPDGGCVLSRGNVNGSEAGCMCYRAWRALRGGACCWRSFISGSSHAYALRLAGTAGSFRSQVAAQARFTGLIMSFFSSFVLLVLWESCLPETCHWWRVSVLSPILFY